MATSGTWNFSLTNSSIVLEAFDRIQVNPTEQLAAAHMMQSARTSLNLELLKWSNKGFNFWKLTSGTIPLVVGQATYTLPTNLVTMTELYYSLVNAGGPGVNQDRIIVAMSRGEYAEIVNKNQQGLPTRYWYQMLDIPQVTIWEVPQAGAAAPTAVLSWYGLQQIQDATLTPLETPDIHYRATEALVSGLTLRLCEKFGPKNPQARQALMTEKKMLAEEAWNDLTRRDQEPGDTVIRMNVSSYARLA